MRRISSAFILILLAACAREPYDPAHDYFSYANTDQFVTTHLALDLATDFDTHQLHGFAILTVDRIDPKATELVLDTRDLGIVDVAVSHVDADWEPVAYELGDNDPVMGSALTIHLPRGFDPRNEFDVRIAYVTSSGATALQWLPPELTAGGKYPYLFSQSQAIHARSWVPLQDTPSVRITYEAVIHTPPELLAVMSANNDPLTPRDGEYHFEMPQPIPPYLLAIAVGNIYFAPIGEATGLYTEPEMLDAASYEFADTQAMLEQAEELFGPYEWGRYDLLILPPSFPYGGMENPRLSFLTPSLLAGDRSLVDVVAHELAHSWSGNLVTNATWRDGWLNEGMTNYLEGRLMEVLYGEDRVAEDKVLGYRELLLDFEEVIPERQALAPPFESGDPDDFQDTIHYYKGHLFLQYLENEFGREAFDQFLAQYFDTYAFETITTEDFLDYLDENLLSTEGSTVTRADVEQWLYHPGLPDTAIIPTSVTLDSAAAQAVAWANGEIDVGELTVNQWSPQATVHFLNSLPADLLAAKLDELDAALELSNTTNAEIGRTWFIQVAERRYIAAYDPLEDHLNRYGRTRLIAPVYQALARNGTDLDLAGDMFEDAKGSYHPITVAKIESYLAAEQ